MRSIVNTCGVEKRSRLAMNSRRKSGAKAMKPWLLDSDTISVPVRLLALCCFRASEV